MGALAGNWYRTPCQIYFGFLTPCEAGVRCDIELPVQIHLLKGSTPALLLPRSCPHGSTSFMPICSWRRYMLRLWSGSTLKVLSRDLTHAAHQGSLACLDVLPAPLLSLPLPSESPASRRGGRDRHSKPCNCVPPV